MTPWQRQLEVAPMLVVEHLAFGLQSQYIRGKFNPNADVGCFDSTNESVSITALVSWLGATSRSEPSSSLPTIAWDAFGPIGSARG